MGTKCQECSCENDDPNFLVCTSCGSQAKENQMQRHLEILREAIEFLAGDSASIYCIDKVKEILKQIDNLD